MVAECKGRIHALRIIGADLEAIKIDSVPVLDAFQPLVSEPPEFLKNIMRKITDANAKLPSDSR